MTFGLLRKNYYYCGCVINQFKHVNPHMSDGMDIVSCNIFLKGTPLSTVTSKVINHLCKPETVDLVPLPNYHYCSLKLYCSSVLFKVRAV